MSVKKKAKKVKSKPKSKAMTSTPLTQTHIEALKALLAKHASKD